MNETANVILSLFVTCALFLPCNSLQNVVEFNIETSVKSGKSTFNCNVHSLRTDVPKLHVITFHSIGYQISALCKSTICVSTFRNDHSRTLFNPLLKVSTYRLFKTNVVQRPGVAKSQKCILVHGQLVVKKHLSVPRHYLPIHKQIQRQNLST